MPPGWTRLSIVAALVTEAVIIACGGARAFAVRKGDDGYETIRRLEWGGVVMSVYVNARWGAMHATGVGVWWWLDIAAGAATLPLFARYGIEAMGTTLRRIPSDVKAKTITVKVDRKQAQATPAATPQPAPAGRLAGRWAAAVARWGDGLTLTELAAREGVTRQAVSQWRKAATNGFTE